jgi:hypothetical protein
VAYNRIIKTKRVVRAMKKLILLIFLICCIISYQANGNSNKVIFEYGIVSYGDGGLISYNPNLVFIKVYENGEYIFLKDENYYHAHIEKGKLDSLIKQLQATKYLNETKYIKTDKGTLVGLHGGYSFIYFNMTSKVILVCDLIPDEKNWNKIIKIVEAYKPKKYKPFIPFNSSWLTNDEDIEMLEIANELYRINNP